MQVKSYNHQSIIQWSNSRTHSQLLACAQVNPDEKNLYNIDILSLDLSDRSKNLNVVGNAFYNVAFRCIAWDTFGEKQNTYPNGVIFGGMEDGSYSLWNASEMINTYNRRDFQNSQQNIQLQSSFLYGQQAQQGSYPIMCAQWNSLKNNFLAFGSTDLLLLDIGKNISNPQIKKPGNRNPHQGSYITSVSWNKQVANILASASQNGLIALWDIKANKSIFEFKDSPSSTNSTGARNVVICWSKTISTQLAVTLDDQKRNQLQIWDLRNQKGPVAVFDRGHTKGINTMQWCQTDPDLILTGGRDNRIVCWNYTQEEGPVSQYSLDNSIFDIKWSKKLRSIYAVSLQDRTQIYSLDNANLFSYVPKWYRVPLGSTFFGNQSIMKYSQSQGQRLVQTKISQITLNSTLSQTSGITTLLKQLQSALDQNSLEQNSKQNKFWNLISIKNSNSGDEAVFDYLGFNKQKIVKQVEKYTGKKRQNPHTTKTEVQPKHKNTKAYTPVVGLEAASFFASIGQTQMKTSKISNQEQEQSQSIKYDMVPRNSNWNIGKQRLIKHNILIGNYEGAIDAAIKCGRTAQALIIAYSVDANTFNSTLKTFFTETTDNFITDVLKNITYRDSEELVRKYDVEAWKECIAMIYSISTSQKRKHLLNVLASKIRQQNLKKTGKNSQDIIAQDNPAIQCYILSQNFDQISNLYYQNLKQKQSGTIQRKQTILQYAKRLILIFNSLTIQIIPNRNFQKMIRQAAYIATQQNFKMVAYMIFSHYLYESSMRQVDMIIHATKNLEEYRNSIVFKQINIPVMQVKQNQTQQGQGQKVKRGQNDAQNQQVANQPVQRGPSFNQNPNIPTKDKGNVQRPAIFNNKKQEEIYVPVVNTPASNMNRGNVNMPPPPPNRTKGPVQNQLQNQAYQQQQAQQPNEAFNKKGPKKVPLPPGMGNKSIHQSIKGVTPPPPPVIAQNNQQQQHQSYENIHSQQTQYENQKKSIPSPIHKNKKVPPPPSNLVNQSMDNGRQREQQSSFYSTQHHQQVTQSAKKTIPPPPPGKMANQNIPPPIVNRNVIKPPPVQHYQEQQQQEVQHSNQGQRIVQPHSAQQSLKTKPPPPPVNVQKSSVVRNQSQQQNSYYSANQTKPSQTSFNQPPSQSHSFNKQPPSDFTSSNSKKNLPPPPVRKQQSHHQQEYEQSSNTRTNIQQQPVAHYQNSVGNSGIKPPPPMKSSIKTPPPPISKVEQHPVQQFTNQAKNVPHQQQYHQQEDRQPQYQTHVIKKPPPPVSGKKGPPPPPRR